MHGSAWKGGLEHGSDEMWKQLNLNTEVNI